MRFKASANQLLSLGTMAMLGAVGCLSIAMLRLIAVDFSHDQSRFRAYRWGEDGIAGVCDTHGRFNIGFSFWNEKEYELCTHALFSNKRSPFLKERLFGLSNPQGNHGESVKEAHFHLDNVPTV